MKKFTSLIFTGMVGRFMPNRFVFALSEGNAGMHTTKMEKNIQSQITRLNDLNQPLSDIQKKGEIDAAGIVLDKYIDLEKSGYESKRQIDLKNDPSKTLPTAEELKKDLLELKAIVITKLGAVAEEANNKRIEEGKKWAEGMSVKLTDVNRKKAGPEDNAAIKKSVDSETVPGNPEMEARKKAWTHNFLYTVYIAEGPAEAERIAKVWAYDSTKWKEALGAEYVDTSTLLKDESDAFGKVIENSKYDGIISALAYEANRQFKIVNDNGEADTNGVAILEAYNAYLKTESVKILNTPNIQSADADKAIRALKTPVEWVAANPDKPEYRYALGKKNAETGKAIVDPYEQLVSRVAGDAQIRFDRILQGIIASAPGDQKKQDALINKFIASAFPNKTLADFDGLSLDQINTLFAATDAAIGDMHAKVTDENLRTSIYGISLGLLYAASELDPATADQYREYFKKASANDSTDMKAVREKEAAYKAKLAEVNTENDSTKKGVLQKAADALAADVLATYKSSLKTPAQFLKEEEARLEAEHPGHPEGAAVAKALGARTEENKVRYDIAVGALSAALQGVDKAQWQAVIDRRMGELKIKKNDFATATDLDTFVSNKEEHKDGAPVGLKAQAYITEMLSKAPAASKPEYLAYVKAQQAKLKVNPAFQDLEKELHPKIITLTPEQVAKLEEAKFKQVRATILPPDTYKTPKVADVPADGGAPAKPDGAGATAGGTPEAPAEKDPGKEFLNKNGKLTDAQVRGALNAEFEKVLGPTSTFDVAVKQQAESTKAELVGKLDEINKERNRRLAMNRRMSVLARASDYINGLTQPSAVKLAPEVDKLCVGGEIREAAKGGPDAAANYLRTYALGVLGMKADDATATAQINEAMGKVKAAYPTDLTKVLIEQMGVLTTASGRTVDSTLNAQLDAYDKFDKQRSGLRPTGAPGEVGTTGGRAPGRRRRAAGNGGASRPSRVAGRGRLGSSRLGRRAVEPASPDAPTPAHAVPDKKIRDEIMRDNPFDPGFEKKQMRGYLPGLVATVINNNAGVNYFTDEDNAYLRQQMQQFKDANGQYKEELWDTYTVRYKDANGDEQIAKVEIQGRAVLVVKK